MDKIAFALLVVGLVCEFFATVKSEPVKYNMTAAGIFFGFLALLVDNALVVFHH